MIIIVIIAVILNIKNVVLAIYKVIRCLGMLVIELSRNYTVSPKKTRHYNIVHNFAKY